MGGQGDNYNYFDNEKNSQRRVRPTRWRSNWSSPEPGDPKGTGRRGEGALNQNLALNLSQNCILLWSPNS